MSYDVDLRAPSGRYVFNANHTSNTAQMWTTAGCPIKDFHDKPAVLLGYAARCAAWRLRKDPEAWRHLEPGSGWGTVKTTIGFLTKIAEACEDHPNACVEVSR